MVLWGCPPPRGYLSFSSVSPEEHGIEGPVPRPPGGSLVGPAQPAVHLPHQGKGLPPQRVRDRAPVPVPWAAPRPAPPPPRPSAPALPSARGWLAGAGVVGVGGRRARRRQGRCCRGGGGGGGCGAPASVGCRGGCTSPAARPAAGAPRPLPPSLRPALPPGLPCPVPPVPWGPRRPCPCPWAPFSPLPVSRVPPPVPHALARPLTHLPSPCPLHLDSLSVPLRALPVPWPLPGPLP